MNNKLKNKISIIFIIILTILSTLLACNALAEEIEHKGKMIIRSEHTHTYPDGSYISFSDLNDYYDVFCCQKRTHLPSSGDTSFTANGVEYSFPYLTKADEGKIIGEVTTTDGNPYNSTYTHETIGRYKIVSTNRATPQEAYILSEMIKVAGMGEYNECQLAWWTTEAGNNGEVPPENALAQESKAFEEYIKKVSGITKAGKLTESDCKYKTAEFTDIETGEKYSIDNAFDFEYKPLWKSDGKFANPTVMYDETTQVFTVGPFAIHYEGETMKFGGREEVQFAGITNMKLYTDASDEPLVLGEDWEIICKETVRSKDVDYEFPKSDEEFYIRLNYVDNATQITNIKTEFRYMNAAGTYQKLHGTYFKCTWTSKSEDNYDDDDEYVDTTYWLELTGMKEEESQMLALGLNGCRWYEYTEIDRSIGIKAKSIKIKKVVVDGNGNKINVPDFFDFKVTVNGAINSGTDKIRVRANSSAESKVYYWKDEDPAPTYNVEEIPNDKYELVGIENGSGDLDSSNEICVIATNKTHDKKGKIDIIKEIQKSEFDDSKESLVGKEFKFKLTVTGDFIYEGKKYTSGGESLELNPVVTAVREGETPNPWTSSEFTWVDDAPEFDVKEVELPENAEFVDLTPESGVLVENETVRIKAINKHKVVGASLHVVKELENSEFLSEDEIKDLHFKFRFHVDGYEDIEKVTNAEREERDGKYFWVWKTGTTEYKWLAGNEPNYTITEFDNPAGTQFVTGSSDSGDVTVGPSTVSGKLVANKDKDFIVTNNIINRYDNGGPKKGNLELTKEIDSDKLKNRDYAFKVILTGRFKFESESDDLLYKERTIQLTNDSYTEIGKPDEYDETKLVIIHVGDTLSEKWSTDNLGLGQIVWYGDNAPKFEVEENLAGSYGEGIVHHTINPSTGNLKESETVKVVAKNFGGPDKEYERGAIEIIKTLEDAEKYDADYINSLVFSFKITVDGHDPIEVNLKAERVDNKFVWHYVSDDYVWEKGTEAPHYTIEEINLPEGTVFVSAKGPDGSTVSGTTISGQLQAKTNSDVEINTENSFINKLDSIDHETNITVKKDVTHESLIGKDFTFTLTIEGTFTYGSEEIVNGKKVIEGIVVKGGSTWTSETITWKGEDAPKYSVTEVKSDIAEVTSVINGSGTLSAEGTTNVTVTFVNEPIPVSGRIKIHKTLQGQPVNENDLFTFRITVEGYEPYEVTIKADETYVSQDYTWYASEEAPKYKVEEVKIPDGAKLVSITNGEGTLSKDTDVTVEVVNSYDEHRGRFILRKEIIYDKVSPEKMPTFEFDITVTGQFTFDSDKSVTSQIWTEHTSITGEGTYESPEFIWYGDEPPVVHVEEKDLSVDGYGWVLVGISNNDAALSESDTIEIVVTNKYEPLVIIDLTMELAGTVWNDIPQTLDKNMEGSDPNGLLDMGEPGVDGVEVYVYDNNGELATIYKDMSKNEIEQPIITSNGGKWDAPRVKVLKEGSYDVKFVYDGQTYEPTKSLVSGSAESYRSASDDERTKWFNDSMAEDINRDEVNQRLTEITGKTPIDGSGNTVGTAIPGLNGSGSDIIYEKSSVEGENRTASKVVTLNKDGSVKDLYKAEASTSKVGLTYPFDDRIHLEDYSIIPSELGPAYRYLYSATYPYTLHINLGLVNREISDMDAIKDLVDAKVVVNERLLTYKFNKLADVGKDVLSRESYINGTDGNNNIKYQVGFYTTDYYYRAEMYKTSQVYDYMDTFYKSLGQTIDATNLEVYLKYKISVYNESPSYQVTINEIADYFDSSFGAPINTEIKKYVQTIDGKETDSSTELQTVARSSYVESTGETVNWNITETGITGSDGLKYNKMTTSALKGMKLASGERAEIYVYFKVEPETVEGVPDTIKLADKSNVVEITNYSTYYSDGRVAGKIDVDSAPDNLNILSYNEKAYYEDDTDSAPVLELKLDTENAERSLSGLAWEDKAEETDDNTAIGNGVYDEGKEALIGGLTTELVEKIKVPQDGAYKEYDFLWPTHENLTCLGGKTFEELTGFDSTTETSRNVGDGETSEVGRYEFTGIPVGNYIVRFLYGNDKSELDDTFGITGDAIALNSDATKFNSEPNILVANYDEDTYGTTTAVYNGQDFKSTLYQIKNNEDITEWHNLKEYEEFNKDSDMYDDEARRLDVTAESQIITNVNGNTLITANTYDTLEGNNPDNYVDLSNHAGLYEDYYMFADSGKINFNVENIEVNDENRAVKNYEIETVETHLGDGSVRVITNERKDAYEVNDVDFGLIERPETKLILDKEISNIKLTTNDNRVIFDAKYDIKYSVETQIPLVNDLTDKVIVSDLGNNKFLIANIKLNEMDSTGIDVMQALDKNENKLTTEGFGGTGTQNFRFINVDDTILQGTTIQLDYKLTVLNLSERDTISAELADISLKDDHNKQETKTEVRNLAKQLAEENRIFSGNPNDVKTLDLGKYVGKEYYKGTKKDTDVNVVTRVRQVVDYVDTDGVFSSSFNNTQNHSWENTTINALLGNGYEQDRLLDSSLVAERSLVDKNGVKYIDDTKNNLILSMDIPKEETTGTNNSGFEKLLQPADFSRLEEEGYDEYKADIDLTVTKVVAASDDADNLTYDNIAEIVKVQNVAGRRDEATMPGNANPEKEQFEESLQERDQSATELVTFTPPTGLEVQTGMTLQVLAIVLVALVIVAGGVVIIKKKVLK